MRAMSRLCEFYPGICLTTEGKARRNLSQGQENLSQSTVYILPKHPHVTKHTHTHTHTLQNNIKPPQYKLKQHSARYTQISHNTIKYPQYKVTLMFVYNTFIHKSFTVVYFTSLHIVTQ